MRSEKGFTLIEMMVVVIIVGVLAAIAVPTYTGYVKRATTAEATSTCGAIWGAMQIYALESALQAASDRVAIDSLYNLDTSGVVYYDYAISLTDTSITATGKTGTRAEGVTVKFDPSQTTPATRTVTTGL
jgi:prepilin-type N-terminal cleavage/methylation domain-containing protein